MGKQAKQLYEFGPFRLDVAERRLLRDGEPVALTPMALETLVALVERSGRLVEKEKLLKTLWPDSFVEEHNLANNISTLRKALGEAKNAAQYIETVPKRGYRFVATVEELSTEMVIKERTRSSIIIEEEEEEEISTLTPSTYPAEPAVTESLRWRVKNKRTLWVVAALVLAVGGPVWLYFSGHPPVPPMRIAAFTSSPDGAGAPHFSPDGNQIAFVWGGEKGDNTDIYTQLVDGGNPLRLTSDPAADKVEIWILGLAVSPDLQWILYTQKDPANKGNITMVENFR